MKSKQPSKAADIFRYEPEDLEPRDSDKARHAAAGLIEASHGVTLGSLKIKDLVNWGRP